MPTALSWIRHTARKLALTPTFTIVTLITLGLAVAANTAVFSVIDGVLLEPLPFPRADRLVSVWHSAPGLNFTEIPQAPALHFTYRDSNRSFEGIGMWSPQGATITGLQEPEVVTSMSVTVDIFQVLGVPPVAGRYFTAEEDAAGAAPTVVLGERYWRERLGADPGVVGTSLEVNGTPSEIVGVYPAGHELASNVTDVYYPFRWDLDEVFVGNFSYQALARLRPDVTVEQASADIERMWPTSFERFPAGVTLEMLREADFAGYVRPLKQDVVGDVGDTLWILLGTVVLVLLIACANVANLFLVRAEGRHLEVAVRTALGASRGRIARSFLGESVTLGLVGGALGLGLAALGIGYLTRNAPAGMPRVEEIGLSPTVVAFAVVISLVAGLLFGLVPVLRHRGDRVAGALKEGGRGGSAGRERHRARNTLVVAQVALALVLLIGSGLMIRTFQALRAVDPGFTAGAETLTLRLSIPSAEIEATPRAAATFQLIRDRLAAMPGVEAVALGSSVPMSGYQSADPVYVEGFPTPEGQIPPIRRFHWLADGYFRTMGTPIVAGREFTRADIDDRADVVVVSENFALEYWDAPADAIGQQLRLPDLGELAPEVESVWRTIVGVAADVRHDGVHQEAPSSVYWPMVVRQFWDAPIFAQRSMVLAIRSPRVTEPGFIDQVRDAIWEVNANLPLAQVRTMDVIAEDSMARTSFTLVMLAIAASVALVLGAVGIYGVTSYVVTQRTREIGVRMALGAQRGDVSGMVLRQGMLVTGVGVLLGLGAAAGLTRLMTAILYQVDPLDPLTYGAVAIALTAVSALACWIPARRAATVDPVVALKFD